MIAAPPAQLEAEDWRVRALFAEARKRRRRIRLAGSAIVAALAVVALTVGLAWTHQRPGSRSGPPPAHRSGTAPGAEGPQLAWVSPSYRVVLGSLATFTTRVVAEANADPSAPLVPFGGHLFWIDQDGGQVDGAYWPRTIEELSLATGRSTELGHGEFMFASAGRRLYISETDTSVAELPAGAASQSRPRNLPAGWYLPAGFSVAVANGIVIQSNDAHSPAQPPDLAVWNPRTGRVTVIGRAIGNNVPNVVGAYTPPGAGYSLLAWIPASCQGLLCPITITNTATLASRTLHSPLGYGFVPGGAFSPDGRYLAVFANARPRPGGRSAELAIVSTENGTVRVVPAVRQTVGAETEWVRWLPGGARLVVLANRDYLVTASSLAARPFRFAGGQEVNFSAELLPARS
jgi:hypothetical protein